MSDAAAGDLRFLIVGLGSMGKRRVRCLKHLGAGSIVGFDPRADRRAEAEQKYGIATVARIEDGFEGEPDAVIISTPPDLHTAYARMAGERDTHFFTEASVIAEGLDELMALCAGKPIVAAPSCTMRFHPLVRVMRDLVRDGAAGRILACTHHSGQYLPDWHPWEDYRAFYAARRATGACREIVPFELNWLTWVLGELTAVSCFNGKLSALEADIDDVYQILLRFEGPILGHLLVDVVARAPYRSCRLLGEEGVIEWVWQDRRVRLFSAADKTWTDYQEPSSTVEAGYINPEEMYIEETRAFVAAICGTAPYPFTLADDRRLLAYLAGIERSADEGARIDVRGAARLQAGATARVN